LIVLEMTSGQFMLSWNC